MATTVLHLVKEDFKFSAAHFLIFDAQRAERLHGHNFQVTVDLYANEVHTFSEQGYVCEFRYFREEIRKKLCSWNEYVLLPKNHPDIKLNEKETTLEVTFRDRFYAFPKNEVILLPTNNISVENLSHILAQNFYDLFKNHGIAKVGVFVSEVSGQGATTECP